MMRTRGVRLAAVVAAVTALAVLFAVLVLHLGVQSALADADAALRARVATRTLLLAVPVVLAAGAFGAWAGGRAGAALTRLRRALLARAGGDAAFPMPASGLREARRLGQAAERVCSGIAHQAGHLERERQELALLVETVSEGLVRIDERGRLVFANPAARRLLALPADAVGRPLHALVRTVELRGLAERVLAGQREEAVEVTVAERRLLVSAEPLDAGGGADGVGGAVIALADLTELRRLEDVRRDFVANVSHELKTPLTSIRGYIETVLEDEDAPADVRRQFLEVARRNAERLQRIVDELLDLSRIESGGWVPEPRVLDAAAAVREAWAGCESRARQQRVAFLPPPAGPEVLADPGALRQVLSNLFENALRYTPAGGTIEVRLGRDEPQPGNGGAPRVRFEVRDTGAGIPGDALPRIFERFYRVDPARSREAGGTGLGLAIVKHLVERMQGDVGAESVLGRGTVIRFRLPAA